MQQVVGSCVALPHILDFLDENVEEFAVLILADGGTPQVGQLKERIFQLLHGELV